MLTISSMMALLYSVMSLSNSTKNQKDALSSLLQSYVGFSFFENLHFLTMIFVNVLFFVFLSEHKDWISCQSMFVHLL